MWLVEGNESELTRESRFLEAWFFSSWCASCRAELHEEEAPVWFDLTDHFWASNCSLYSATCNSMWLSRVEDSGRKIWCIHHYTKSLERKFDMHILHSDCDHWRAVRTSVFGVDRHRSWRCWTIDQVLGRYFEWFSHWDCDRSAINDLGKRFTALSLSPLGKHICLTVLG